MVRWADICREPFRILFPLGILFGLLGVGHWLAYGAGWVSRYSGFYHASLQIQGFIACFIAGFLLTALPRFAAAPPASSRELGFLLALLLVNSVCLSYGQWVVAELAFAGLLLALAVFAARRFAGRRAGLGPPSEFIWLPFSLGYGVLGTLLLIGGQAGLLPGWAFAVGRPLSQQGFPLGVVIGVAGFLAPRLMGRAFTPLTGDLNPDAARRASQRRSAWHAAGAALFGVSFVVEGAGWIGAAYLLRALVATGAFLSTTRMHRPVDASAPLYVKLLWVAIWGILIGLWGAGLHPARRVAMLHITFIGGFSLMMFAVGLMVVASHGGAPHRLAQPLWALQLAGAGVALALLLRVGAEWRAEHFFASLALAALAWSAAAVGWLLFTLPFLLRPPPPEAFERMHEEAKRRLAR